MQEASCKVQGEAGDGAQDETRNTGMIRKPVFVWRARGRAKLWCHFHDHFINCWGGNLRVAASPMGCGGRTEPRRAQGSSLSLCRGGARPHHFGACSTQP